MTDAVDPPSEGIGPHASDLIIERMQRTERSGELEYTVDEISIYNPRTENYHVLNGTASAVWDLATGEHDLGGILETLAADYDTTPDAIEHDVKTVIRSFEDAGLLEG